MAIARPRLARQTSRPAPRPGRHGGAGAADDASDAPETDGPSLAELVAEAAEARELSLREVAEALSLSRAALDARLARPATLSRAEVETLARILGADRTLFRRAVDAAAARDHGHDAADDEASADASSTATAPPTPAPSPVASADAAIAPAPIAGSSRPAPPAEPPPLEAIDVVARAIDAIGTIGADVDAGMRLRAAVLVAAADAARDAGRTVPASWRDAHAAAAPRADGASLVDATAGEGDAESDAHEEPGARSDADTARAARAERDAVLLAVARTVEALQRLAPGYDDVLAPLTDEGMTELLRRLTIRLHAAPLGGTSASVLVAPLFGRYLLVHSAGATADQRRVAERRAAAHVVAGHVRADAPLPVPAPLDGPFERVADVVALADLVPFWQLHDLRRARGGRRTMVAHVSALTGAIAGDWEPARVADRAELRVELYRRHGV